MPDTPKSPLAKQPPAVLRLVTAHLRNFRMSPRKMRVVAQTVLRLPVVRALDHLKMMRRAPAAPLAKLIASAVANAGHNFQIAKDDLVIHEILVNQGPTLKRWRPRAFGRAGQIRKRSSHVTVRLVERPGATRKAAVMPAVQATAEPLKTMTLDELKRSVGAVGEGAGEKGGETPKGKGGGFRRKLFQRKAG